MKYYTVKMEIEAPSKEVLDGWIERMPHSENIFDCEIEDPDEPKFQARIRYDADWNGRGEHYVFENKWSDEEEWGLETAYKLLDCDDQKGELVNYRALAQIRQWMRLGIGFYFK